MADVTIPEEVVDKPEPPEAGAKPAHPEESGKSGQSDVGGGPKPSETSEKSKPTEASGKPADASGESGIKRAGKILLYICLVAAALFLVKYFFFTPPEVAVIQVRRQDFTGEVQGTGTINVDVLAAIGAKIPGRIDRMLVDEGDFVRPGQVVATLEDTDIRQVLQRSQAQLEEARMSGNAAAATERSAQAEERSARATAQSRRATKYQTERAWERETHLVATGAVSQEEADQYEERDRTAGSAVGAADAGIVAAQAQIEAAGAKVQAARSAVVAADAEVRLQRFNLSETKIFTYVRGVVTDRPKRSGDAIVSGETVVTVADFKVTLVEAYLDQRLAGQIRAGQTATVILRGRPKEPIQGRVFRVRPQADPAAEELTVEISFAEPPVELQLGQWADVYVQTSQTKAALVVPATSAMTMGDGSYVLVVGTDHRVRRVDIEPIASSPRSAVIAVAGGLKPGEWVLTQPMGVEAGTKVRPTQGKAATGSGSKASNPAMKM